MNARDHLLACENALSDAKAHVESAIAQIGSHGKSLLIPFVQQCLERLSDTLPDDAWIMECKGAVVTAGQARALVKWWDEGENEIAPRAEGEFGSNSELQKLRAFYEAAAPLMERESRRRGDILAMRSNYSYAGCPVGHPGNVPERYIDAALAAYDAVGECKREGK